jgi:signal transduction histidine kinase/ActR/RegA family two-component response regulator
MHYLPQATHQHHLPLPRIRSILADASASTMLQLALWSLDGQLLVAAGDDLRPNPDIASVKISIHSDDQAVATLIGQGNQPNLYQLVHLIGQRIEDRLAAETEINSLASEIIHTYDVLHVLYDLTATLGSVMDMTSIGTVVTERILEPLGALQSSVTLLNNSEERLLARHTRSAVPAQIAGPDAVAYAPLMANGERIGTIAVQGKLWGEHFSSADLKLLDSAAILTASALQHARLRGRELALCDQVRWQIAKAPLELNALLQSVAQSLATTFSFSLVECWLIEDGVLRLKSRAGDGDLSERLSRTEGTCAQAVQQRRSILVEDLTHAVVAAPAAPDLYAQMCVPLFCTGDVVGVLNIADSTPLRYHDLQLIESIIVQVNIAIENARLLEEIQSTNAKLLQASKLAAIGTLAAGVSHEFNNVLTSIQGFAELGLRGGVPQKDEALQVVLRGTKRGVEITRGLLTFARPTKSQHVTVALTRVADEALHLIGPDFDHHGIQVEQVYQSPGKVGGDPTQLVQVVLNLLTNARDAMLTTGGTVTLTVTENHEQAILEIRDTGLGTPEEILGRIFDPFVTSKGALGGGHLGGTGLGLAVSQSIVRAHGGELRVQSRPSEGSCFTILLPRSDEVSAEHDATARTSAQPAVDGKLRILLVEDEPDVRTLLSTLLNHEGHIVEEVGDGEAALALCEPGRWDVIISDLTMPKMDGRSLIMEIRAQHDPTPVILITGVSDRAIQNTVLQIGATLVLPKPFTAADFLQAIATVCSAQMES